MILVRDLFRCKPGQAREVAERFRRAFAALAAHGEPARFRLLVDVVASYWTVVLETEVSDLSEFERHMSGWAAVPEVATIMKGYMDLIEGGHREIFRILD
jgi:hypothetical protein